MLSRNISGVETKKLYLFANNFHVFICKYCTGISGRKKEMILHSPVCVYGMQILYLCLLYVKGCLTSKPRILKTLE